MSSATNGERETRREGWDRGGENRTWERKIVRNSCNDLPPRFHLKIKSYADIIRVG